MELTLGNKTPDMHHMDLLLRVGLLAPLLASCAGPHTTDIDGGAMSVQRPVTNAELIGFDVVQHTCALYVTVRSNALEGPLAFGRDTEQLDIHWNKCTGGTMVACAKVPGADGDSVLTGIPFPY